MECDLTKYINDGNIKEKIIEVFGGESSKLYVIIGNSPYLEMDGGAQASASPLKEC